MRRVPLPDGGCGGEIKQQDTERVHTRCVMTEADVTGSQGSLGETSI